MSTTRLADRPAPATEASGARPQRRTSVAGRAVLLIGHGSTRSTRPEALLNRLAVALVAEGRVTEAAAAMLRGGPSPRERLDAMRERRVTVVPMLMCDGLLFREAIPRALGLTNGGPQEVGEHIVHLCAPIGLHPMVADLIVRRVGRTLDEAGASPNDVTLLLIAHGSTRDGASAAALARQAERVRGRSSWRTVETAFIGQAPHLVDALAALPPPIYGVALFTARGNHVIEDIERHFQSCSANEAHFLGAVGEEQDMIDVIAHVVAGQAG